MQRTHDFIGKNFGSAAGYILERMNNLPDLSTLDDAAVLVHRSVPPTPQYAWPLLQGLAGAELWVKHENHTPTGAFKVRGGLTYLEALRRRAPGCAGIVSATRGNHGQSLGFAARRQGLRVTVVVPHGNSVEKNAAMRALGVELVEHGDDFQDAREHAELLATRDRLHMVPSFDADLLLGVASYWLEFLRAVPGLDTVLVPIGLGSGVCSAVLARRALGLRTRIIGVVSQHADAYARAFESHAIAAAPVATQIADGMACRIPDAQAMDIIWRHVDDIVRVDDAAVAEAMGLYYTATHNVAEGAGAAALAAAIKLRDRLRGQRVGVVLSGANVDLDVFTRAVAGNVPACGGRGSALASLRQPS